MYWTDALWLIGVSILAGVVFLAFGLPSYH
jgi:hypothetical protein